ncbi:molecular chaperone [Serratia sp. UGAL515B_01]|uniref:fimbrial biogenesis chaperone n=1 Tax=Serratia sp. UGAL515B_01 TaxID=2986763 RepID=UPI002953365E|nr:molecular chaperone [Serratia sp. UGAL515B_01]WON77763.1 molecular chaperone [Serratia sp. UGAL515B_01]
MKFFTKLLLLITIFTISNIVQASVIIGAMRLVYLGDKKEVSLKVNNPEQVPYLVQAKIKNSIEGGGNPPFLITPPLFRLDGGQQNTLRVVRASGNLPTDKESLYWIAIKSIASSTKDNDQNQVKIALTSNIKLIYRPEGVKGIPEDVAGKLTWQRNGNRLQVTNPTPFYMNFYEVKVAGKQIKDVTYVAPGSTANFILPAGVNEGNVSWTLISDYGSFGQEHSAAL